MVKKTKKNSVMGKSIELAVKNNQPVVSSLVVAEHFGKRHDNVLRDIESLECSENFRLLNFEEIFYSDNYGREQPAYNITRDGFTILAMGFTGKRAMKWKELYIEAFNSMEKALRNGVSPQKSKKGLELFSMKTTLPFGEIGISTWGLALEMGRSHDEVMTKIENMDMPDDFREENFYPLYHVVDNGPRIKTYGLTSNGFGMVGHIFHGKAAKAALWKGYAELKAAATKPEQEATRTSRSTPIRTPRFHLPFVPEDKMLALKGFLATWAFMEQISYSELENELCAYMQVMSLDGITKANYEHAMEYIWSGMQVLKNNFADGICSKEDLQPFRGLLDFTVYYEREEITYDFILNRLREENGFQDFSTVAKADLLKLIMIAWGNMYAMCFGDSAGCCKGSCIHQQFPKE